MTTWVSAFCNKCGYVDTFEIEPKDDKTQEELVDEKSKEPCSNCGSVDRTWV